MRAAVIIRQAQLHRHRRPLTLIAQARGMAGAVGNTGGGRQRVVLWFRGTDLRLTDNVMVHEACRRVQADGAEVVPVFTFDPRWFQQTRWSNGMLKTGPFRAQFLLESVLDLKDRLRAVGSDLLICMGPPEHVLPALASGAKVLAQREVTSEETGCEAAVAEALQGVGASLEVHWDSTMYHLDDLPFRKDLTDMPDGFTPFKQKCEDRCRVREPLAPPKKGALPLPSAGIDPSDLQRRPQSIEELNAIVPKGHPRLSPPSSDPRAALAFKGGETAALARVQYYLWDSDLVADYFQTRNGMLGGDYSTKLAPWLAHGCVSPRQVHAEVLRYERERTANKSTYWVRFELTWRDYFRFFALKHGDALFHAHGTQGRGARWGSDPELLQRWKSGITGWPLVDANMRELAATGFMSNRGRQNVASLLALDFGVDWRAGADWFESLLVDYDVASNWGNWAAAAGVTGGRVNRFNIVKQGKDYDLQGDYVRHWCPELAKVPASRIHEPWLMSKEEQQRCGVHIGVDYPLPVPASQMPGRGDGGGGTGGGRGGRGGAGGGRASAPPRFSNGSGRKGRDKDFRPRSAYDLYG